jgi:hypothetical protein
MIKYRRRKGRCLRMRYAAGRKRISANVMHLQFLQRVLNGEANYGRQIVTISSTDGKIIGYARPEYPAVSL